MFNFDNMKSVCRRLLKYLAGSLAVVLFTVVTVILVLLGSGAARQWTVNHGLSWLNDHAAMQTSGLNIELADFTFTRLNQLAFAQLIIYKNSDTWIAIKDFSLTFSLQNLWQQEIVIQNLLVEQLRYNHLTGTDETRAPSKVEPTQNSAGTASWPAIIIEQTTINDLHIANLVPAGLLPPETANNTLHYALSAQGDFSQQRKLNLNLTLNARNSHQPDINLTVNSDTPTRSTLQILVQAEPNSWLSHWLRTPAEQPPQLELSAQLAQSDKQLSLQLDQLKLPLAHSQLTAQVYLSYSRDASNWQLSANRGRLTVDKSEHSFSGALTEHSLQAQLKLNQLPLAVARPWLAKIDDGTVSSAIDLAGSLQTPEFSAELSSNVVYDAKPFNLQASARGDRQTIEINTLQARYHDALMTAQGTIDTRGADNSLSFQVSQLSTELLPSFGLAIPENLSATIDSITGELFGSLQSPTANLTVLGEGQYRQEPFQLNGDLAVDKEWVNVNALVLELNQGHARVNGRFNWQQQHSDLVAELEQIPVQLVELAGITLPETLVANTSARATLRGPIDKIQMQASAQMRGELQHTPFTVELNAESLGPDLTLSKLEINSQQKTVVSASGNYQGGHQGGRYALNLDINELSLAQLQVFNPAIPAGVLDSKLDLHGNTSDLALQGEINFATALTSTTKRDQNQPVHLMFKNQLTTRASTIHIESQIVQGQRQSGTISSQLPIKPYLQHFTDSTNNPQPLPLALQTSAKLDLSASSAFLDPELSQLKGELLADVGISGNLSQPSLSGTVELNESGYYNFLTGTRLENFNCRLDAQGQLFTLQGCTASDGDEGRFNLTGKVKLPHQDDPGNLATSVEIISAQIIRRADIESQTTGQLNITGNFNELSAKGDLEVAPFEAIIDMNVGSAAPELEVTEIYAEGEAPQAAKPAPGPLVNLDINITASQQAFLRGRGLEAELNGSIYLSGTSVRPQYNGEFNTIRGEMELFGKTFAIKQGQVSFVNNATAIAIIGQYDQRDREITAKISGQNDDYEITFSSVPSMPEDEILSYIIFGESLANIEPLKAIQLALAIQKLSGGGSSFDALGTARELLDVDSITIENQAADGDSEGGLNIGVGKYLNDRTYLELERTPDPAAPWKGNIEIELTPRIFLNSTTGGSSGLDNAELIWQKDY